VVLFEFWICPVVVGQIWDFKYKQLPNLDKLTSRSITCMAQDSTGFLWIGTVDGLNRYNGYEVDVYRTSSKKSVGLPSNEITSIFVDSKNRIWVGTPFGISVFNSSKDEFIPVESTVVGLGFRDLIVNGITEDNFGRVLAAAGNSVYAFNESTIKFDQIIGSPNGEISAILVDSVNGLWLGHWNGRVAYSSFKNGTL
jgi:ligand-binding sensor domain-containing protein